MALIKSAEVYIECEGESFSYTETTGAYNATTNPGGYGAPNPATGDITSATMYITNLTTEVEYDAITWTPSSANLETIVELADLLVDTVAIDEILDGVWEFRYVSFVGATEYTLETRLLVMKDINCDMASVAKKIADRSCGCCNNGKFIAYAQELFLLWETLKLSPICGDVTLINNQLEEIQDLLENINCVNC